jgi:hypothetical protein
LSEALNTSKKSGRTPMIVKSKEALISSTDVFEALRQQSYRLNPVYLRDLALEAQEVKFEERPKFLEKKHNLMEGLVDRLVMGEDIGQILLNFDESNCYISPKKLRMMKSGESEDGNRD